MFERFASAKAFEGVSASDILQKLRISVSSVWSELLFFMCLALWYDENPVETESLNLSAGLIPISCILLLCLCVTVLDGVT